MTDDTIEEKNHLTPLEYHKTTKILAQKIKESGFIPDVVVGVVRGGLIPAVYMSHLLGKIPLYGVRASVRDWSEFHVQQILEEKLNSGDIKKVLVVDDIADSGEVIGMLKNYFKDHKSLDVRFATVYVKERCLDKVDYYGKISDGRWIIFPYDIENKH
jgi:hypoxanthine phosphoribosyltransferase